MEPPKMSRRRHHATNKEGALRLGQEKCQTHNMHGAQLRAGGLPHMDFTAMAPNVLDRLGDARQRRGHCNSASEANAGAVGPEVLAVRRQG